jgi:glycosyltransferase involved in cell wall biosynthesis
VAKIKLLVVNYAEDSLIRELLSKGYEVVVSSTREGKRLVLQTANQRFDLVYFAKFYPPLWDDIDILLNKVRAPVIYAFHSPSIIFTPFRPKNYLHNIISSLKLAHMKIGRSITAVHVLNSDEHKLLRLSGLKCYYIPLGVDTKLFRPSVKNNKFTIVFVSARYQTGADMLLEIVPKVLRKAPDVKFMLIDKGFLGTYFDSLKNGFSHNIEAYERLPQNKFAYLLSSSHVLLLPARWESFGLIVLEALSCGMPVVCYDITGAPRDLVKRYGVGAVADPFDVEEIVNGVLKYYELWQKEEYERLSGACRNIALKYDWSTIADLFSDMFKQILEPKHKSIA